MIEENIHKKVKALEASFGGLPWFHSAEAGELGGDPAIFVYLKPGAKFWHIPVPKYWRGVKVWLRQIRNEEKEKSND